MVENTVETAQDEALTQVFRALGHPVRRALVARMASQGPATVGVLAAPLALSEQAVSKHLKVLERAAVIERRPVGRTTVCALADRSPVPDATAWLQSLAAFWTPRLDRLASLFPHEPTDDHGDHDTH